MKKIMQVVRKSVLLKVSLLCLLGLAIGFYFLFRSKSLHLTDSQRTTISPEAQKVLDGFKYNRLPDFMHLDAKMIMGARAGITADDAKSKKIAEQYGITIRRDTLADVPVYYLTPSGDYNKTAIGFYTHGGGFVMGSALDFPSMDLARRLNTQIVTVEYSLAPEAKFSTAVNQCFAVYKEVAKANETKKMFVVGGSAGGNLAITTILQARDNHVKLPNVAAIFTPIVDVKGLGDTYISNDGSDLLVWQGFIERIFTDNVYFTKATDLKTPLLSSLYADYSNGFVPTVLITGTWDLLLGDVVRFHQKLKTSGVPTELLVFEGMWHGFSGFPDVPEGKQAHKQVVDFLQPYLR